MRDFEVLKGKTLVDVTENGDTMTFTTVDGEVYQLCHYQDCCESVYIEDICGDLTDLIGSEILLAECPNNEPPANFNPSHYESCTWTFYKLATIKGYVDIRFFGSSNGYYSEGVSFVKVK